MLLAHIEITIYCPGLTMSVAEMNELDHGLFIHQEVIDYWVRRLRSYTLEGAIDGSPYHVARELTKEESEANHRNSYVLTDWGMTVSIDPFDPDGSQSGYPRRNWMEEEFSNTGFDNFLQQHLESILQEACKCTDGLFKRQIKDWENEPIHTIRFLSQWEMHCGQSGFEYREWDCNIWMEGRVDPKSLRVLE